MANQKTIQPLFASPFYQDDYSAKQSSLLKQLLKECYQFHEIDEQGQRWSEKNYWNGYTSYGSLTDLWNYSSTFLTLKKLLLKSAQQYQKSLHLPENGSLELTDLWINIMKPGSFHAFHHHPGSVVSGTIYLTAPKGSGVFKIEDPMFILRSHYPQDRLNGFLEVKPMPGLMILFESFLKHEVTVHRGLKDRVSISFNFDWVKC